MAGWSAPPPSLPGQLLFENVSVASEADYTDTVLPDLPGIYRSLLVAVSYSSSVSPAPVELVLNDPNGLNMLGRLGYVNLLPAALSNFWFPLIPLGKTQQNILTIDNLTGSSIEVTAWVDTDVQALTQVLANAGNNSNYTATSGQVALSGAAQAVSRGGAGRRALTVYAPSTNAKDVYLGFSNGVSSGTGDIVEPGYGRTLLQQTQVYAIGTAGDVLSWNDG